MSVLLRDPGSQDRGPESQAEPGAAKTRHPAPGPAETRDSQDSQDPRVAPGRSQVAPGSKKGVILRPKNDPYFVPIGHYFVSEPTFRQGNGHIWSFSPYGAPWRPMAPQVEIWANPMGGP